MDPINPVTATKKYSEILGLDETYVEVRSLKRALTVLTDSGLSPDLVELRNLVLNSHWRCEDLLEEILAKNLYKTARPTILKDVKGSSRFKEFKNKTSIFFRRFGFSEKVSLLKDLEVIDDFTVARLNKINKVRNRFSHPDLESLKNYQDIKSQWVLLEIIKTCLFELGSISSAFGF